MKKLVDQLLQLTRSLIPLKERKPKFKRPEAVKNSTERNASYSWLINDFIPSQPDRVALMQLSILLGFRFDLVVAAMMGEARLIQELEKTGVSESNKEDDE